VWGGVKGDVEDLLNKTRVALTLSLKITFLLKTTETKKFVRDTLRGVLIF
jgi:hypothetical protein